MGYPPVAAPLWPMFSFNILRKHQKILGFLFFFRGYKVGTLPRNRLKPKKHTVDISTSFEFNDDKAPSFLLDGFFWTICSKIISWILATWKVKGECWKIEKLLINIPANVFLSSLVKYISLLVYRLYLNIYSGGRKTSTKNILFKFHNDWSGRWKNTSRYW